ncbi:MAG: C39 family peptidase [Candidatus Roizmanbacteria bacterium]
MKLKNFLIYLLIGIQLICTFPVLAQEASPTPSQTPNPTSATTEQQTQLEKRISEYEKQLEEARSKRSTLAGELENLRTQTYITQERIKKLEAQVAIIQNEVDLLGKRIESLDNKLDLQLKSFLQTAREKYKKRTVTLLDYILEAENATALLTSLKYHQVAEARAQAIVLETEETKQNFEEQKQLREKRKEELAQTQLQLQAQKNELINQQQSKNILIAVTRNDESVYQARIAEARLQIQSLKSFRISTGADVISAGSFGTGEGGYYYSQRDARWAGIRMGNSSETVLDVGCFITSLSMVLTHYGHTITPAYFASNSQYFLPYSAWAYSPAVFNGSWPGGLAYREIGNSEIDGYLSRGIPVISSVRGQSHYVVLKKKVDGEYIMNDPIYGPDLKLSQYYSLSGRAAVFE